MDVIQNIAILALISANLLFGASLSSSISFLTASEVSSLKELCALSAARHIAYKEINAKIPPLIIELDIAPRMVDKICAKVAQRGTILELSPPRGKFEEEPFKETTFISQDSSLIHHRIRKELDEAPWEVIHDAHFDIARSRYIGIPMGNPKKCPSIIQLPRVDGINGSKQLQFKCCSQIKSLLKTWKESHPSEKLWSMRRTSEENTFFAISYADEFSLIHMWNSKTHRPLGFAPNMKQLQQLHRLDTEDWWYSDIRAINSDGSLILYYNNSDEKPYLIIHEGVLEHQLKMIDLEKIIALNAIANKFWKKGQSCPVDTPERSALYQALPVALKQARFFALPEPKPTTIAPHLMYIQPSGPKDPSSSSSHSSASKPETRKRSSRPDEEADESEAKEAKQQCVRTETTKACVPCDDDNDDEEDDEEWDKTADPKGKKKARRQ